MFSIRYSFESSCFISFSEFDLHLFCFDYELIASEKFWFQVKEVRRQQKDQQRAKRNLQGVRGGGQQGRGGASNARGTGRGGGGQHGWNREKSAVQ